MEQRKPIRGHEKSHMVSDYGRVMSLSRQVKCRNGYRLARGRIMKTSIGTTGYPKIQLEHRGKTHNVHTLVAEAFIERPSWATQVNHIDGVKTNNKATNLEWVNQSLNQLHAYSIGLQKPFSLGGEKHPKARGVLARSVRGEEVGRWGCVSDCARDLGLRLGSVFRVLYGVRKVYAGMVFTYTDPT